MYDEDEPQVDITKLRYVLYARKSTDDPQRQIRSIDDQIDECKLLAERNGMRIVKVLKEEKSAKIPGKRKVFKDELIAGIENNKYDAILAWNPDRLARNMIEGSSILNYIDSGKLQDLKFVTHYFTNDASGKMLLGISFVMADYYSRNLSQNVTRGVKKGFKEGKSSGTPKHGYIRGEDGIYRPDNEDGSKNFDLICQAWRMRKDNKSLESIANYMTDNGYSRTYKEKAQKAGMKVLMTDKILSDRVFNDPFYYGILIQKGKIVDLRDLPGYDFTPATDEQTYNSVQSLTGRRAATEKPRVVFKPLTRMVMCAYCQRSMIPQTPTSGRKSEKVKILSYRCDTEFCPRRKEKLNLAKSIRAKVVFDFMTDMLSQLQVGEQEYQKVLAKLTAANQAKQQQATVELHSKQGALKSLKREIDDRSLKILDIKNSAIYRANESRINEMESQSIQLQDEVLKLQERQTVPQEDMISFQDFLNVANNASELLRAADVAAKDRIARLIYLNVTVDDQKVVDYQMREPFKTLFKTYEILPGRGDRT